MLGRLFSFEAHLVLQAALELILALLLLVLGQLLSSLVRLLLCLPCLFFCCDVELSQREMLVILKLASGKGVVEGGFVLLISNSAHLPHKRTVGRCVAGVEVYEHLFAVSLLLLWRAAVSEPGKDLAFIVLSHFLY